MPMTSSDRPWQKHVIGMYIRPLKQPVKQAGHQGDHPCAFMQRIMIATYDYLSYSCTAVHVQLVDLPCLLLGVLDQQQVCRHSGRGVSIPTMPCVRPFAASHIARHTYKYKSNTIANCTTESRLPRHHVPVAVKTQPGTGKQYFMPCCHTSQYRGPLYAVLRFGPPVIHTL